MMKSENEKKKTCNSSWGRHAKSASVSEYLLTLFETVVVVFLSPLVVLTLSSSCSHFDCSLLQTFKTFLHDPYHFITYFPRFTLKAFCILTAWYFFQVLLYILVPGKICFGQKTPAGHVLKYKTNGLSCWLITHVLIASLIYFKWFTLFPASIICDNLEGLLISANIYGFVLSLFVYMKAHLFPTHSQDCKFGDNALYDFLMGVEFNPRITDNFDFKLFHNGRPGIIAWTLINAAFALKQLHSFGYISNSMLLVNAIQGIYAFDFFFNEDWYLKTIDINHDHFGFYLAWGDMVWLPFIYTLPCCYLSLHPTDVSPAYFSTLFLLGLTGYVIFRITNNQKYHFRLALENNQDYFVLGKKAEYIIAKYATKDSSHYHTSYLLTSGFWGLARSFNFTGDLMMDLAVTLACGFEHFHPHVYFLFKFILLTARVFRIEGRCTAKYGKYWQRYCEVVPYRMIPYLW